MKTKNEVILYKTKDGPELKVNFQDETVWLSINQIGALFGLDKTGVSKHINNIYKSGELKESSTVAKIATVQKEGKRSVERQIEYYNLDLVLSVGYRVNSKEATSFRIWANSMNNT